MHRRLAWAWAARRTALVPTTPARWHCAASSAADRRKGRGSGGGGGGGGRRPDRKLGPDDHARLATGRLGRIVGAGKLGQALSYLAKLEADGIANEFHYVACLGGCRRPGQVKALLDRLAAQDGLRRTLPVQNAAHAAWLRAGRPAEALAALLDEGGEGGGAAEGAPGRVGRRRQLPGQGRAGAVVNALKRMRTGTPAKREQCLGYLRALTNLGTWYRSGWRAVPP